MEYLNEMFDDFYDELICQYPELHTMISDLIGIYRYPVNATLKLEIHQSKKKREIDIDHRCRARVGAGKQCSRAHMSDSEYCRSHRENTIYGDIDGPEPHILKKRGRHSKSKPLNVEDLDLTKYIQAIRIKINDESYLVDENDIVYKQSADNEIVGRLSGDVINWF